LSKNDVPLPYLLIIHPNFSPIVRKGPPWTVALRPRFAGSINGKQSLERRGSELSMAEGVIAMLQWVASNGCAYQRVWLPTGVPANGCAYQRVCLPTGCLQWNASNGLPPDHQSYPPDATTELPATCLINPPFRFYIIDDLIHVS